MDDKIQELYDVTWHCPGPDRRSDLVDGEFAGVGTVVNYDKCMDYPDCACRRFDEQTRKIEKAIEAED
jgi:hypothetical protein